MPTTWECSACKRVMTVRRNTATRPRTDSGKDSSLAPSLKVFVSNIVDLKLRTLKGTESMCHSFSRALLHYDLLSCSDSMHHHSPHAVVSLQYAAHIFGAIIVQGASAFSIAEEVRKVFSVLCTLFFCSIVSSLCTFLIVCSNTGEPASPLLQRQTSINGLRREPQSPRHDERRASRLSGFFGFGSSIGLMKEKEQPVISGPTGPMVHKIHVDLNWKWEGEDPAKVFKLERRLGEGAYGVVHKAVHADTNFPLAIKIVNMNGMCSSALCVCV